MSSLHSLEIETQAVDCTTFSIIMPKPLSTPQHSFTSYVVSGRRKKRKETEFRSVSPFINFSKQHSEQNRFIYIFFFKIHK